MSSTPTHGLFPRASAILMHHTTCATRLTPGTNQSRNHQSGICAALKSGNNCNTGSQTMIPGCAPAFLQICKKAGAQPGIMVWLPVLQLFPLLRAAQMPLWWFLLWFVPGVNLVAQVVWCIKIADARGKSPWVGVLLILPVTNIFTFLYLAFSGNAAAAEAA